MGCCSYQRPQLQDQPIQNERPNYFDPPANSYPSAPYAKISKPSGQEKIEFCPFNHPRTSIIANHGSELTCNNCFKSYEVKRNVPFFACSMCKYQGCRRCYSNFTHQYICDKPNLAFSSKFTRPSFGSQCCFCGKFIAHVVFCRSCQAIACVYCMDIKKKLRCQHNFKFNQEEEMGCVYCQKKGQFFMRCKQCKLSMCKKCYKELFSQK